MASAVPRPATRTTSRCVTQKARGTHAFEINDYSVHRALGRGKLISSTAFDVGGYSWCIMLYPDGCLSEDAKGHISVFLKLLTMKTEVRALYDLRMVDQRKGSSCSIFCNTAPSEFSTMVESTQKSAWGRRPFFKTTDLESSGYLRGDRLVIECDVTVIMETHVLVEDQAVQVPPSNMLHKFGKLLETGEASDVSFIVETEVFRAHKIMLAVQSPVFKAELYGPIGKEDHREFIAIKDMQPATFKALLHFIYTDSLPSVELDGSENKDLIMQLLVAADRYAVDRLKLICEGILCKRVDVDNVVSMLVLADQLNCRNLKDACLRYMGDSNRVDNAVEGKQSGKPKKFMCCFPF